jgi:hypothetical protein
MLVLSIGMKQGRVREIFDKNPLLDCVPRVGPVKRGLWVFMGKYCLITKSEHRQVSCVRQDEKWEKISVGKGP